MTKIYIVSQIYIVMCKHLEVEKRVTEDNDSTIVEHHFFCNHSSGFDYFSVLASNNNDFKVTLMESLLINRDYLPLNKASITLSI